MLLRSFLRILLCKKSIDMKRLLNSFLEFELLAEMTVCYGYRIKYNYLKTVEECKTYCGRRVPLFTFGRRGGGACNLDKCHCQCEWDSIWKTGQCEEIESTNTEHSLYDLFRYTSKCVHKE